MTDLPQVHDRNVHRATLLASTTVLLPLVVALLVGYVLKVINPSGVDVSNGLAYLAPILLVGWGGLLVMVALNAVLIVRLRRAAGTEAARLPMSVLIAQVVLGALLLVLQMVTDGLG